MIHLTLQETRRKGDFKVRIFNRQAVPSIVKNNFGQRNIKMKRTVFDMIKRTQRRKGSFSTLYM